MSVRAYMRRRRLNYAKLEFYRAAMAMPLGLLSEHEVDAATILVVDPEFQKVLKNVEGGKREGQD